MNVVRKANDRGFADHGWLKSRHTFSFAAYYDPAHVGFGPLRVINEDRVAGGGGFGRHPHADMEILSYVISGALEHEDSMGNRAVIKPGELQRMSAGSGVTHAEFNSSATDPVHFLQIWITPNQRGQAPSYAQKDFSRQLDGGEWVLVASPDGRDQSLSIRQDAYVLIARPRAAQSLRFDVKAGRGAWVQVVKGSLTIGADTLIAGDAIATDQTGPRDVRATEDSELILFDLP